MVPRHKFSAYPRLPKSYIYIYEIIQLEPLENIQLEPFWNKIMGGSNCGRVLTVQFLVKQGKLGGSKCVARILEKKRF